MAPAAAPPHQGRPADRAGPGGWPDRQGAGRLASPAAAAASRPGRAPAEAARGRRRRVGGGSGGGFLGRGGLASLRVGRGSAAAREPGDPQLRPSRRPAFPAALARSSGGSSSFVWVRSPARGAADLAPAPTPATAGAGGARRRQLVASSPPPRPPHRQRRPARPSHLQRALGTERACASGGRASEPPPGAHRAGQRRRPCRSRVQRPSSRLQQSPLGPPPGPGAHYPGSPEKPARSMRATALAEAPAGRGVEEARGPAAGVGLCWGCAGGAFQTDRP